MKKLFFVLCAVVLFGGAVNAQNVTFQVNMAVQIEQGDFDPTTDLVVVRGSFQGWAGDGNPLAALNDSVYAGTFDLSAFAGTTVEYKFAISPDGWESVPNRTFAVPASGDASIDVVYFNDLGRVVTALVNMTFSVDMELQRLTGAFDPARDTVSVNGNFVTPAWTGKAFMAYPNPLSPDIYVANGDFEVFAGQMLEYKYWYGYGSAGTWESVANRTYTITADDLAAGSIVFPQASFNNSDLSTVLANACTVVFSVYVGQAYGPTGDFTMPVDNVVICGSTAPLQWPGLGWPDSDISKAIFLFDDGTNGDATAGDNVWSNTLVFPAYSSLATEYKYGINFATANNQGSNDNEEGVGTNHTLPWESSWEYFTTIDTFNVAKRADVVSVEDVPGVLPTKYSVEQNFPNPFNPTTTIQFSIPEAGFVSLKVYNVVGQEVATLVNEAKTMGTYEVNFDASNLTSGIYFYTINAGNFTSTKKMTLLK